MRFLLFCCAVLSISQGIAQDWQPFYPSEKAFYITDSNYRSNQVEGQVAIPEGSILGINIESSESNQNGTIYFNHIRTARQHPIVSETILPC